MWNRKTVVSGSLIAVVGLLGACSDIPPTQPVSQSTDALSASSFQASGEFQGRDGMFAQLAREIPGFGGIYYDEAGRLNLQMAQEVARMTPQLAGTLGTRLRAVGVDVDAVEIQNAVVHRARYDFAQLHAWHQRVAPVLSMPNVVVTDVDEASNRLRIGVEEGTSTAAIEQAVRDLGVPAEAVTVFETAPIELAQAVVTLRDRIRPIPGGVQINFPGFLCTLGFNIRNVPIGPGDHFFTNSHCTNVQGTVTGTPYWQPLQSVDPTVIGIEVWDPPFFTGDPCPAGRFCRYSDAAVAQYQIAEVDFGRVARPFPGSIVLPSPDSRTQIRGEQPFPLMGQPMYKVGRTTGLTVGLTILTCITANVGNVTLFCQDVVQAGVASGDSGSPVLSMPGHRLTGILWGSGAGGFVMSAMENIRFEFPGPWITH